MNRIIWFSLFIILCVSFQSYAQNINYFEGSPEELFKYADKKDKPIIIDFYTAWCGYCKKLDKTTFVDPEVVKTVNKNYVMYKLDAESPFGRPLAKDNNITGYPCIIIYDSHGNIIGRINGYLSADKFLAQINALKDIEAEVHTNTPITSTESSISLQELFKDRLDSLKLIVLARFNEQQTTHLMEAEMWGTKNNIFEFDELTYTAQNAEDNTHLPYLPLFFAIGQANSYHIHEELQNMFENEILTPTELNYFSMYVLTHHKINLLSLQMINDAALSNPSSFEILLGKTAIQKFYGDIEDAKDTAKKAKKIASKQKLDATIIDTLLSI